MRKIWLSAVGLYLAAQILFLIGVQFPSKVNFDEFHYVPAAKNIVQFDKITNREHPPLGKFIISAGIQALGDVPAGWRLMSTIFGALTLVGMYFWGLALFRDEKLALWVAVITLFNQLLYVQARIAMLDTFMFAFMAWGLAAFTSTWWADLPEKTVRSRLLATGILFGLATACKWFGVMAWLSCLGMVSLVALFRQWGVTFQSATPVCKSSDWYSPNLWQGITFQDWVMYLGLIPVMVYFLTFVPYTFFKEGISLTKIFSFQLDMYGDQLRVVGTHPYMSQWKDWPLMNRPIWYAFDAEPGGAHRCVILLGNPLVMWGGLAALAFCAYGFVRDRSREGFLILLTYLGLFGTWALIPRKVSFFYYYYPAGMVLSFALAYPIYCLQKSNPKAAKMVSWCVLGATAALFIYFFPVLAGSKVPGEAFRKYMWFTSWI